MQSTGVNLGKEFLISLKRYNITPDMIVSITQDNAGNCKTLKGYLVNESGNILVK
jgi:hypothetical protein